MSRRPYDEDYYEDVPVKKSASSGGASRGGKPTSGARRANGAGRVNASGTRTGSSAYRAREANPSAKPRQSGTARARYNDYDFYEDAVAPRARVRAESERRPGNGPTYPTRPRQGVKRRKKKRTNPMLIALCMVLALALAFAIGQVLRANVFEIVKVSGDAMYENMMDGDVALITKFDYNSADPVRGDVVAIRMSDGQGVIMRRVVGLPGETIELNGETTMIDGQAMPERYVSLKSYDNFPAKTLAAGKYYVLGDNRANWADSRDSSVGTISRDQIIGKVRYVVWPLNHLGSY